MEREFAERDVPDTIPDHLVARYGRAARNTVGRSARPSAQERIARWSGRLTAAVIVVAILGAVAGLALFLVAIPAARWLVVVALGLGIPVVVLLAWPGRPGRR